jgi:hypothetical protein
MMIDPAASLKLAGYAAFGSTTLLTATAVPSPESFSGWGVHLVLGAVAVAALYVVWRIADRQMQSVKDQSEALLQLSRSIDDSASHVRALATELKRSPCILHRLQERREELSPEVAEIFGRERRREHQ